MKNLKLVLGTGCLLLSSAAVHAQQVINNSLVVVGSECIGQDCPNAPSFGFDTLRLQENNLRINFDDTSNSASFPLNDWRIIINDTTNGGQSKFAIEDTTGGRTPFTIEASAPTNSLYVDDGGRLGLGTASPVVDVHVLSGNTPTMRLEQDGSSGFAAQTWDVAGNEANFFIRDATNGSKLPLRIFPNAPSSSIHILSNGNTGFGYSAPTASMHVRRTDGTAQLFVEEASTTAAARTLFALSNKGNTKFSVTNTDAAVEWSFANPGTSFRVSRQGSGVVEMELFNNGNMTIAGTLTQLSDVNAKTSITDVNAEEVLDLVAELPVKRWEYKKARGEAHIGPMAQDFYAAFGLGATDLGISSIDTAGVALVAIQALIKKNNALELAIAELQSENRSLINRQNAKLDKVDQLEQMVIQLMQAQENHRVLTSAK